MRGMCTILRYVSSNTHLHCSGTHVTINDYSSIAKWIVCSAKSRVTTRNDLHTYTQSHRHTITHKHAIIHLFPPLLSLSVSPSLSLSLCLSLSLPLPLCLSYTVFFIKSQEYQMSVHYPFRGIYDCSSPLSDQEAI